MPRRNAMEVCKVLWMSEVGEGSSLGPPIHSEW